MTVQRFKAIRDGHKSAAKILLRKSEEAQKNMIVNYSELDALLEELMQKQNVLRSVDENILNEIAEEQIEGETIHADEYHLNFTTKIKQFRSYKDKLHRDSEPKNLAQNLQLPKLTLPKFYGDVLTWQTFWDSFEAAVHLNPSLTDRNFVTSNRNLKMKQRIPLRDLL